MNISTRDRILVMLAFMASIILFVSCDPDPPTEPEGPVVTKCTVSGDISVDFSVKKGWINLVSYDTLQGINFSAIAISGSKTYDLAFSIFPENLKDTSGIFHIDSSLNMNHTGNWAIVGFTVDNEKPTEMNYYPVSGVFNIEKLYIGKKYNAIKGTFNFIARDSSGTREIQVSDGWVDLLKGY
jgi:hypothetical protein